MHPLVCYFGCCPAQLKTLLSLKHSMFFSVFPTLKKERKEEEKNLQHSYSQYIKREIGFIFDEEVLQWGNVTISVGKCLHWIIKIFKERENFPKLFKNLHKGPPTNDNFFKVEIALKMYKSSQKNTIKWLEPYQTPSGFKFQ